MNKEETLALWQKGKDAWNAWAHQMLARRAEMERDGTWAASRNVLGHEGPGDEATAGWMDEAAADFEGQAFEAVADFRGFLSGAAKFENATFEQVAGFDRATLGGDAVSAGDTAGVTRGSMKWEGYRRIRAVRRRDVQRHRRV